MCCVIYHSEDLVTFYLLCLNSCPSSALLEPGWCTYNGQRVWKAKIATEEAATVAVIKVFF